MARWYSIQRHVIKFVSDWQVGGFSPVSYTNKAALKIKKKEIKLRVIKQIERIAKTTDYDTGPSRL